MISLASWLHGLNTTIGQSFFENIAHHLCEGEKRSYTSKRLGNLKITRGQKSKINEIMTSLSDSSKTPDLTSEVYAVDNLLNNEQNEKLINAMDFSTDVYFETETDIIAIELKSVKPNSGEMRGEKHKILEAKTALKRLYSDKDIQFFIGFPFDPTVDLDNDTPCCFDKNRFMDSVINLRKYFAPEEVLIASELWNKLSGTTGTMEDILTIINTIATPQFIAQFNYLLNNENRDKDRYRVILEKWYLISELKLLDKDEYIKQAITNDPSLKREYNKSPFKNRGAYNVSRYYKLINL